MGDEYIKRSDVLIKLEIAYDMARLDQKLPISDLQHEVNLIKAADVQPVNQWISVNDRLPENCIEVLVYDTDCGIVIGWYDKEIDDFAADFISLLDAVTHWQPLPKPPVNN